MGTSRDEKGVREKNHVLLNLSQIHQVFSKKVIGIIMNCEETWRKRPKKLFKMCEKSWFSGLHAIPWFKNFLEKKRRRHEK